MKNIAIVSLCVFLCGSSTAQKEEYTPVRSSIKNITLFLNGAQIKRSCVFQVLPGTNLIKITDLPYSVDARSVKIEGQPGITLVSVNHRNNYLLEAPKNPAYAKLVAERDALVLQARRHSNDLNILHEEIQLLYANQQIKGENEVLNSEKLLDYADAWQDRLIDISLKRQDLEKKNEELNERIRKINQQMREMESRYNRNTSEILLNITAAAAKKVTLEFSYSTTAARWLPYYDLRSDDVNNPVSVELKAKVTQWTGEDWTDIRLTLSTGNPSENHELPKPTTWQLYAYQRAAKNSKGRGYAQKSSELNSISMDAPMAAQGKDNSLYETELTTTSANTTITKKEITTEYKIAVPYSIPSDSKLYDVEISVLQNPALYHYYAAPRVAHGAYLLASLPDWQKLNLLDGDANIYYHKTYIGKTHIASEIFTDTLDVSLGKDPNVVVDRQRVKAVGAVQIAGNTKTETYVYEISVRNNKSGNIEIDIQDVIPVSQDKEIVVKKLADNDAAYDETRGVLTWKLKLAAGETQKIRFSYSVKYPRTRKLYGM